MESMAGAFRLLGDATRLRVLRLLAREELNGGELTTILGLGASSVSRQVALLREAGLVSERRNGRYVFFSLSDEARRPDGPWSAHLRGLRDAEDDAGDLGRLRDVLRRRREQELDGAGRRQFVPGRSWAAWARSLARLVPGGLRVADVCCGDGELTLEIAAFADQVVAVDRDPAVLRSARAGAKRRGARNVRFRKGDMHALPLDDASFDVVVLSQALHYAEEPGRALAEAFRVLVPDGRLLLLDLLPHDEDWVRDRLGHLHLGFEPAELERVVADAGFRDVEVERMPSRARAVFRVVLATGARPARRRRRR